MLVIRSLLWGCACLALASCTLDLGVANTTKPKTATVLAPQGPTAETRPTPSPATASPKPTPTAVSPSKDPLLRITTSGGRCVNGACRSEIVIENGGAFTVTNGVSSPVQGKIAKADVDALVLAIAQTDFPKIMAVKFEGTCPTAYDGSEAHYVFNAPGGLQDIGSCAVAIDKASLLFKAVAKVVADVDTSVAAVPAPTPSPRPSVTPLPTTATDLPAGQPVLRVSTSGGMCPTGVCGSETVINRDGSYSAAAGGKLAPNKVPKADMDAMVREILAADFAKIASVKFTGTCPTAYDGSEVTYTFNAPPGLQTIASCTVEIDQGSPLFKAAAKVLEATRQP
ncbi:MAG: hypothetical protein JWM80_792 [Cyanobacteria bacterium RYN_339]|nr:hypothetical protein [Cyanobacteria bacterium RYN_339]